MSVVYSTFGITIAFKSYSLCEFTVFYIDVLDIQYLKFDFPVCYMCYNFTLFKKPTKNSHCNNFTTHTFELHGYIMLTV